MSFSIFFPFSISWFQNLWLALCGIYTKKLKFYILDDPRRQKAKDDKLWKREFTWATQHGWTRCGVHASNVKERVEWFYLGQLETI
jgi:hypothetical protein